MKSITNFSKRQAWESTSTEESRGSIHPDSYEYTQVGYFPTYKPKVPKKETEVFQKRAAYYGWSAHGYKVHLGSEVQYIVDKNILKVDAWCGSIMYSYASGDMPPPQFAREFCKNCFRTYAWELMVRYMDSLEDKSPYI